MDIERDILAYGFDVRDLIVRRGILEVGLEKRRVTEKDTRICMLNDKWVFVIAKKYKIWTSKILKERDFR